MQKKYFIYLAKKYANKTATKLEAQQVEAFYAAMQEKHKSMPINLSSKRKNKIKKAIDASIPKTESKFNYKYISIAASLLLLLGLGATYSFLNTNKTTITALKGERKEVLLEDGSHIFLNSNSSISYTSNFTEERNITLKGEAFFNVAKNQKKPFTVTANTTEIKVLGTSFNINATNAAKTLVSVNTGKVLVQSKRNPKNQVTLIKNQQVSFLKDTLQKITYNNSDDLIAWTKDIIFLNNETLEDTAKILENWYNVTIDLKDEEIKHETISGKFNNEALQNVIKSIALLKNLKIEYSSPNHIIIRKKQMK